MSNCDYCGDPTCPETCPDSEDAEATDQVIEATRQGRTVPGGKGRAAKALKDAADKIPPAERRR